MGIDLRWPTIVLYLFLSTSHVHTMYNHLHVIESFLGGFWGDFENPSTHLASCFVPTELYYNVMCCMSVDDSVYSLLCMIIYENCSLHTHLLFSSQVFSCSGELLTHP